MGFLGGIWRIFLGTAAMFFRGRVGVHAGELVYDLHVWGGLQGAVEEEEDEEEEEDMDEEEMRSLTAARGSISGGGGGGGAGVPLW